MPPSRASLTRRRSTTDILPVHRIARFIFVAGLISALSLRADETVGTLLLWSGPTLTIAAPPDGRSTAFYLDEDSQWNVDHKPVMGARVRVVWEKRGTRDYCTFVEAAGVTGGKRDYIYRRGEAGKTSFLGHITRRKGTSLTFEALNGTVYAMVADNVTDFSGFPKDSYAIPMVRIYYVRKGNEYLVVKFETL